MTQDGALIARHENELSDSTDVATRPEFASRKTTKTIDGQRVIGWFSEDFTLAEVKTLRAKERLPKIRPESAKFDGKFDVATFDEVVALARKRGIGVYPEMKHPTHFHSVKLDMVGAMASALKAHGLDDPRAKVFVQCFEVGPLQRLRALVKSPLVQLLSPIGRPFDLTLASDPRGYADLATPEGLKFIASYAQGIGPSKDLVVPKGPRGLGTPTELVREARRQKLKVHVWTFRDEAQFLPLSTDPDSEIAAFLDAGADGLFTDFPARAVKARDKFWAALKAEGR